MINKSITIVFSISILLQLKLYCQQITFKPWNDSIYGVLDTFPANAVADDFGPRRCCSPTNRNWHGGVDYNSFQNTGNNGNDDLWDMILAPEDGTIVDVNRLWTTSNTYKQLCYEAGNHRYIFGHVYDNAGSSYVKNDSTIILKQMLKPGPLDPDRWAQIFIVSGDTITYGQIDSGLVVWNSDTLLVRNIVSAGNPLVPLGESAANGAAHLHLNTIPLNKDHSTGATTYNSNPLQYIDYDKADYDINLYSQGDTNGIHIVYPGTDITPIATKVKMQTTVSGIGNKRYDHIFDVNRVRLLVSNGTFTDSLLRGPAKQSITNLGGRLNENKVNHANPLFGSWTRTGVFSAAYNAGYPNMPYDIYHYSDFVHRIHKDDPMDGGQAQIADCPDESRYIDGHYKIYTEVTDIRDSTFYSDTLSFTLDNWKPYIKDVLIFIGDSLIYNEDWTCNNDCVQFSNNNLNPTLSGADLENDMSITVTVSEPLDSLSLSIPSLGVSNQVLVPSDDSLIWDTTIDAYILSNLQPAEISFEFSGSDNNNNQLISFPSSAPGDCFAIPTRDTNTTFDDPNTINLTFGIDSIHGFQINCAAIDTLKGGQNSDSRNSGYQTIISIDAPAITAEETIDDSYCYPECNNGSISIQVDNADAYNIEWSTGDTTFDLADLDAGSYTYTITDNLCGYLEGTVAIECNPIEIQFQTTPSCDNDGTIEAIVFGGEAPYTFIWQDDANETTNIRTGLGSNLYRLRVTDSNDCTNEASVFIKNVDPIDIENMEYYITNAHCDVPGSISIYPPSGGSAPFTYACSNGVSGSLDDEDGDVIYNLTAGNYTVTLTDVEGCSATLQFEIGLDGLPDIAVITVEHTCAGEEDGLVALDFTDYTINWSTGATGNIISDLAQGLYYYTVTDTDNGCSAQESIEIEALDADSDPIMASTVSVSNCIGGDSDNGKIFLTVSGGIPPYSYYWSNGSTTKNIKKLGQGDYYVTITDKCDLTGVFSEYVDATEVVANSDWALNFGEIAITTDPVGGEAPYSFLWGDGETTQDIDVTQEGSYKVTITDSNGCLVKETIDISFDCEPLAIILDVLPEGYDCNIPASFGFDPVSGNSFPEGTAPFKVKIEKQIDQEWITMTYSIINSLNALNNYQYALPTNGTFKVSVIDNCGDRFEEVYQGCLDCNYEFYTGGDDNDEVYVDMFQGMITFEQVCPCDNDCDLFGFTHDKIKLYVDENAISNSDLPPVEFNFTIIWPNDKKTIIGKGTNEDPEEVLVQGPTEYVLSDDDFDNGISITVEYHLVKNWNLELQCTAEIPFTFGQLGYNGAFFYFVPAEINPFSNSGFEGPYYDGNFACSTACAIPLESGVLYANQPEVPYEVVVDCEVEDIVNYFRFYPIDWADPCFGGGYLRTLVEANGGIYLNEVYIPANTALAQASWNVALPLDDQGNWCDQSTFNKGFCLFEGIDVYGVETIRHLIAPFCEVEMFIPIIDSDNDGIPDDEDPCPYVTGIFCDDEDDEDDDVPNWDPGSGCVALFEEEQCLVNIVCDASPATTIYGTISEEFYSGSDPCYHCFSADVCRIPNPQGGPDFVSIVGDINDMLSTYPVTNSTQLDCVCGYAFYCGDENSLLGTNCMDEPCIDGPPSNLLFDVVCRFANNNTGIITLQNDEDDIESYLQHPTISKDAALSIVKAQQRYNEPELRIISIPNPSDGVFDLQIMSEKAERGMVQIINIVGEIMYNKEITIQRGENLYRIDGKFNSGLYYIAFRVNGQIEQTIKHVVY